MTTVSSTKDLGRIVKAERLRRRLKQPQLAAEAKVGTRFISDLERGKPTVQMQKVFDVALALGIQLHAKLTKDVQ